MPEIMQRLLSQTLELVASCCCCPAAFDAVAGFGVLVLWHFKCTLRPPNQTTNAAAITIIKTAIRKSMFLSKGRSRVKTGLRSNQRITLCNIALIRCNDWSVYNVSVQSTDSANNSIISWHVIRLCCQLPVVCHCCVVTVNPTDLLI